MNYMNLYGRFFFAADDTAAGGGGTPPAPDAPAAEGMRKLDIAAGGDEVPVGPLGGPVAKTREELVVEENTAIKEQAEAEIEAAGGGEETPPEPAPLT